MATYSWPQRPATGGSCLGKKRQVRKLLFIYLEYQGDSALLFMEGKDPVPLILRCCEGPLNCPSKSFET